MSIIEALAKRDRCYTTYGGSYYCYSDWYYWGRWALFGVAVLVFFVVLLSCCFIARRRRRRGAQPYYGTGWMAPPPKYGAHQNDYQLNQGGQWAGANYQNPPPAYPQNAHQPQYTATTYNPNEGYYGPGGQPYGVQSPPVAHQGDYVYPPAPAPPGGK